MTTIAERPAPAGPQQGTWRLVSSPQSIQVSRRLVDAAARQAHRGDSAARRLMLVVSELVTNAVTHGRPPLEVTLRSADDAWVIIVADHEPLPPVLREAAQYAQSGRGLRITDRIASEWGWHPTEDGKYVWALVPWQDPAEDEGPRS